MAAILFVLRTGCQWSALKGTGICHPSSAYRRWREWTAAKVFERFWQEGLMEYDHFKGINWSWVSMDGAMTKAPLGGEATGPNPTDRAKKGTKRSILTDAEGVPISLVIDGANRHDFKLMEATLDGIMVQQPGRKDWGVKRLCLDKGYDYEAAHAISWLAGFKPCIASRGQEKKRIRRRPGRRARRWVVERTHSWMNRFRRILTRWEKRADTYQAMLHLALGIITFRLSDAPKSAA